MRGSIQPTLWCLRVICLAAATLISSPALGDSISAEERAAIDKRLGRPAEIGKGGTITIQEGDTVYIEHNEIVPANRFTKKVGDYEGAVLGITSPKGVVVHARADELRLEPRDDKMVVTLRFAIHVDPGSNTGGRVNAAPAVIERTGLANTVVQSKKTYVINVVQQISRPQDLAADFYGYRLYQEQANAKLASLTQKGVSGLSIADQGRIPPLDRVSVEVAREVYSFERDRRRMWVAHRHLIAARTSKNEKVASLAKSYLSNLDKSSGDLSGVPAVGILGEGSKPPPEDSKTAQSEPLKPSGVETLKPVGVEPAGSGGSGSKSGTLSPTGAYEFGSETEDDEPTEPQRPKEDPPKAPKTVAKPDPNQPNQPNQSDPGQPNAVAGTGELGAQPSDSSRVRDDFMEGRAVKEIPIPSFPRSLVLDDVNIAHEVGVRFSFASIDLRGTSGVAPAFFYHGQLSLTREIGVELTIPTAYVNVDVSRAQALYVMGNPLLAAKLRLYLPSVEGRRPALTIRARWGIPISPLNTIPPTTLGAEEFSFPAHFVDTYAFLLEKSDLGLGASAAWQVGMIYAGLQLYGDYFIPVDAALDRTSFPTLSYGASVGVLPIGDQLGIYLEGRATTLMSGPTRTEFFTYLGARFSFLEYMEVAGWGSLPIGSVSRVSSLQFGLDLRVKYDVVDVVTVGRTGSRDQPLLE